MTAVGADALAGAAMTYEAGSGPAPCPTTTTSGEPAPCGGVPVGSVCGGKATGADAMTGAGAGVTTIEAAGAGADVGARRDAVSDRGGATAFVGGGAATGAGAVARSGIGALAGGGGVAPTSTRFTPAP